MAPDRNGAATTYEPNGENPDPDPWSWHYRFSSRLPKGKYMAWSFGHAEQLTSGGTRSPSVFVRTVAASSAWL